MTTALRAVFLLGLSVLWTAASHAAEVTAPFKEEFSRQEKIYRSDRQGVLAGYTVDRSLSIYGQGLSSGFLGTLRKLGAADRWLDIGAGEGQAILDYYQPGDEASDVERRDRPAAKAQAIAMSIEDRRTPLWRQTAESLGGDRIKYLADKRLRDYSPEQLGTFQIITDVIGGFSYTENLTQYLDKVLGLLAVKGSFYTMLQDVSWGEGTNRPYYANSPFLTEIIGRDDAEVKVCAWLKRISCVEVTCEPRPKWTPPVEAFRIQKVCDAVSVPPLTPVHFEAGTPPERRFRLGESEKPDAPVSAAQ